MLHPDMTWYKNARFGMFIHWGLYAIPGGVWKGEKYSSEWIMNRAKIPAAEYEKLAGQFNPVNFSAESIVKLARDAGMKYLVITAKHHDGFAMFHSRASKYNIVDATPFKRDVILELANECARQGTRFGVYYSQAQDWHHPHGAGNIWDWPDDSKKDFQKYLNELVYPQMEELLTNYGDISVLWFDTPMKITAEQARNLINYVREKQPQCIINSRLGPGSEKGWGDFTSLRDNEVPTIPLKEYAETCATLNNSWGFSSNDQSWKRAEDVVRLLSDITAKNANYLLNIGPDAMGNVPEKSAEILKEVGEWLQTNGEAIYNTEPSPFNINFHWGSITRKPGRLYCHLTNHKDDVFKIFGIHNTVSNAFYLDEPEISLEVIQKAVGEKNGIKSAMVKLGEENHSKFHKVLCLEMENGADPIVDTRIMQQPDYSVVLESLLARDKLTGESVAPEIMVRGAVGKSLEEGITLTWDFEVYKPGKFKLTAECATGRYMDFGGARVADTGHEVEISVFGKVIDAVIREELRKPVRGNPHWPCIYSSLGEIEIGSSGTYTIDMKINKVVMGNGDGFILRNIKLELQQNITGEL